MTTMLRWSTTRQFHFHHDLDALLPGFFNGAADEAAQRVTAWLPAAAGRIDVTIEGERKADHDTTGKDYFLRELAYGAFQRTFALPEGADVAHVEAKYAKQHARGAGPRAARCDAEDDRSQGRLIQNGRGPRPCRGQPGHAAASDVWEI